MTSTDELTDEQLQAFQDQMFKAAKENLERDGYVMPVTSILARRMEIDQWLRGTIVDATTWKPPNDDGSAPMEYIFLIIPCLYDDLKTLVHMIKYLSLDPMETSKIFDVIIASAPKSELVDPYRTIVNLVKQQMGITENKDLVANFLYAVCKSTDALAYVKVDEAWYKPVPIPKGKVAKTAREANEFMPGGSLQDDMEAKEMLMCYLETKTIKKHISEPFERDVRGTGKIVSWGKKEVLLDDGKTGQKLDGRFCHLLQPRPPGSEG